MFNIKTLVHLKYVKKKFTAALFPSLYKHQYKISEVFRFDKNEQKEKSILICLVLIVISPFIL